MPRKNDAITLRITRRELATILAALRFHQDENLQGSSDIPDTFLKEIATDGGLFKPLSFMEVGKLCERLNTDKSQPADEGPVIEQFHMNPSPATRPVGAPRKGHRGRQAQPKQKG